MEVIPFQGNYIDLIIVVVLLIWIFEGWERGFSEVFSDLVGLAGAFLFGFRFYSRAAFILIEYFSISRSFANAMGFLFVYVVAHAIIEGILLKVLREIPQKYFPQFLQRFLALLLAAVNGFIIISVVLTLIVSLPVRGDVKEAVSDSEIGGLMIKNTTALDQKVDEIFKGAIQESLAFLTVSPGGEQSVTLGFELHPIEYEYSEDLEKEMYVLVNEERLTRGISELSWDPKILEVAREHARDMFENGYFSHINVGGEDVSDRLQEGGVSYFAAGENLAFAPVLSIAHKGLMQSPGHRANILASEFRRVGIGVVDGGTYGKMFVQVFTD